MLNLVFGRNSRLSQILLALSASLLSFSFFTPLWKIELWAPQYPEGLSMSIWSHKLTGDITTINILNHYIGMSPIDAASFPELQFFPIIFSVLILTGLGAALLGRRCISNTWVFGLLAFALWALYDFYKWEYKFGHELNPDAAIKMEDMVYQPPLIGTKEFLNITATSWPSWAGVAFSLSVLLALAVLFLEYKSVDNKI